MDPELSPLALKLTSSLFPHAKDAAAKAAKIDNVMLWHERDERERIRNENKVRPSFCDNVMVKRSRYDDARFTANDYFELQLMPAEPDAPYEVMLKRYSVPGRCWVYAFQWVRSRHQGEGPRVVYGAETEDLPAAIKQVTKDLNRPAVLSLFERAFAEEQVVCRYHYDCIHLLAAIAPRSKALKVVEEMTEKALTARKARLVAERVIKADVAASLS